VWKSNNPLILQIIEKSIGNRHLFVLTNKKAASDNSLVIRSDWPFCVYTQKACSPLRGSVDLSEGLNLFKPQREKISLVA